MKAWNWIDMTLVNAIHDRQLSEHGGAAGIRDEAAIESALARAQCLVAYENPDAATLAAAYCYGIVKNHGYVDGNKRTGWILARLFLMDNDATLKFNPIEAVNLVEDVASNVVSEDDLSAWFRERLSK